MPDDLDWLYGPISAGWLKYESLIDGTVNLDDIAEMNEALAVQAENRARVEEHAAQRRR
jgi:hypothetical protein